VSWERPVHQEQGPDCKCEIAGRCLGWENCTPCAFGMAAQKASLGKVNLSGCSIRRATGDTSGGTTLNQCANVVRARGVRVVTYVGTSVASLTTIAGWLRAGRGVVLQGNTSAMVGTSYQVTAGPVNHAVYVNEVRGRASTGEPLEALVYDPAADGRLASYGRRPKGAEWWPWSLVKKFAGALRPNEPVSSYTLASRRPGHAYCAVFDDTEPHAHLRFAGSVRCSPLPTRLVFSSPREGGRVNVRSGPSTSYPILSTASDGARFAAYQQNDQGQLLAGSRRWYGSHDGTRWVHSSGLEPVR
jgi:hypothetical protein